MIIVPHLLTERRDLLSVWVRLLSLVEFVGLSIALLEYCPDALTFFEGNY